MQNVDQVSEMYHRGYQTDALGIKAVVANEIIGTALFNMFTPARSLDVGSGPGGLVRALRLHGVNAQGVDGSTHAKEISDEQITTWDLREVFSFEKPFDLVTCFDTAEHIEEEFALALCTTLARNTRHMRYCVFGPAPEGQDGLGHVNLQHPVWWIDKMDGVGLQLRPIATEQLRKSIRATEAHNHLWWIAKNLMVFQKVAP